MIDAVKNSRVVQYIRKSTGLINFYHYVWAVLGVLLYGREDKKLYIIGVTGTKGKTTTLEFLNAILEEAGKKTALLSSLRVKIGEDSEKNLVGNTMPGRLSIRKFLQRAVKAGCRYALIEVTSQGVEHFRHRFISWNAGMLTNLAPEHIESHGSFEAYRKAKLSFLEYALDVHGRVFINRDDQNAEFFLEHLRGAGVETYSGRDPSLDDLFSKIHPMHRVVGKEENEFLVSQFNRSNAAGAVAVAKSIGISEKFIELALREFKGVPGRMEFIIKKPISVIVDYAHTPDSLLAVYTFLREKIAKMIYPHIPEKPRLICVLGACGGGRDKWKRPSMGKIAAEQCDEIVLTGEDPYDEQPEKIIEEIFSGCSQIRNPKSEIRKLIDRREGIQKAISLAKEGDMVIITGKGSEDFFHIARGKKIPWSDRKVVEEVIQQKKAESPLKESMWNKA